MEMIRDIIKQFYLIPMMVVCVLFVISIFFASSIEGKDDIFQGVGSLFSVAIKEEEITCDGLKYIDSSVSTYVPVVRYAAGAQNAGTDIVFKEQLEVTKEDGSVVSGSVEDEFAIYLLDIRNQAGNSVLIKMTAEEIISMEEIPAPFVYEKEQDILCCFVSGIYTVRIKVYGANGGAEIYEFKLPVEIG